MLSLSLNILLFCKYNDHKYLLYDIDIDITDIIDIYGYLSDNYTQFSFVLYIMYTLLIQFCLHVNPSVPVRTNNNIF